MKEVKINLRRLVAIAQITEPCRTKRGWKKKLTKKDEEILKEAFAQYCKFWVRVIKKHIKDYDIRLYKIDMTKIHVSKQVCDIIADILEGLTFFQFAPVWDRTLESNICLIDDQHVLRKRGE